MKNKDKLVIAEAIDRLDRIQWSIEQLIKQNDKSIPITEINSIRKAIIDTSKYILKEKSVK